MSSALTPSPPYSGTLCMSLLPLSQEPHSGRIDQQLPIDPIAHPPDPPHPWRQALQTSSEAHEIPKVSLGLQPAPIQLLPKTVHTRRRLHHLDGADAMRALIAVAQASAGHASGPGHLVIDGSAAIKQIRGIIQSVAQQISCAF